MNCDGCTMCCKIMRVEELNKPRNEWCPHCDKGKGCRTYDERPQSCRDFKCGWLETQERSDRPMPLEMRPDHSHVVMTMRTDGKGVVLHVDPARPLSHEKGTTAKLVAFLLTRGEEVIIACGDSRKLLKGIKA